ncbi:MAG: response regulator [Alphaproteobacteria bacterium]|nr:response regulator [Alphaproteobacteria bacterium]MBF0251744.1 response regulator [Alphaproteobacteria bacterium]
MDSSGLKYCSVLVVDDSASSRTLLATTMQDIGVGRVTTVPNGIAAIEHMKRTSPASSMDGAYPPVDLMICEWDMEPVGGLMLANWVRRSADSPDRFTRCAIMSGSLDMEKIARARGAGVNTFLAKPFTIQSLKKGLLGVVMDNPPFYKSNTYFGPDRRRQNAEVPEERRHLDLSTKLFGEGDDPSVGCIKVPPYLAAIMTGRPRERLDFSFSNDIHTQLRGFREDYADWVRDDVRSLRETFAQANQDADHRISCLNRIKTLATRLKREGEALGYPLISAFAHTLNNAVKADERMWDSTSEIFDTAIKGLEAVARERIGGDGGPLGKALNASLIEMDEKLIRLTPVSGRRKGTVYG